MCRKLVDVASFSNFNTVAIKHIDLDWEVNFDKEFINGAAFIHFDVLKPTTQIILDSRDLTINHIFNNDGDELQFVLNKRGALGEEINITTPSLNPGDKCVLKILYCTSNKASALQFLSKELTADKKMPFLYSQCQAIHVRSIIPSMDTPAVKQTYAARIRVPKGMTCLMSALAEDKNDSLPKNVDSNYGNIELGLHYKPTMTGEVDTFYYKQPIKIPSYLIAIVAACLEHRELSQRCEIWAEPSLVDGAAKEFVDTEIMLKQAEELMGPYRWGRYDLVVLPPSFPFGGMENPCLTFVTPTIIAGDKSLTNVIAHEIAHSWTGNLVTNGSWEHFWLNEGFTVFVERKIMGRIYGEALRQFENICGWEDRMIPTINETFNPTHEFTKLNPDLTGIDPDDSYSTIPYEKGSSLLLYLEQLLGDTARFEQFLRDYIVKFALKSIVTDDWKDYLYEYFADKKQLLDKINWHAWFKEPGVPPNKPTFEEEYIKECRRLANLWIKGSDEEIDAESVESFTKLTSVMKVKVLDTIESSVPLSKERVAKMEEKYGLSKSGNCEILYSFLLIVLKAKYEPLIDCALNFSCKYGRLKYAKPVFGKLFGWIVTHDRAIERFNKNIPTMHPITVHVIKTVMDATKINA